jgi:ABC-2 type transport system ATP-binding protein
MLQRLGLADVLIKNPEVIILDEPTLGIDLQASGNSWILSSGLSREQGITVLFCSHSSPSGTAGMRPGGNFCQGKTDSRGNIQTLSENLFAGSPYTVEVD